MHKKPDPLREAAHNRHMDTAYKEMKAVEERLRKEDPHNVWNNPEHTKYWNIWRHLYNSCRNCGSDDVRVENYDRMWSDGDIICNECNCYVRMYDAG